MILNLAEVLFPCVKTVSFVFLTPKWGDLPKVTKSELLLCYEARLDAASDCKSILT